MGAFTDLITRVLATTPNGPSTSPEQQKPHFGVPSRNEQRALRRKPSILLYSEDKLKEAQFFFEHMADSLNTRAAFCYYMSAFLNAARAITQSLRGDFGKRDGFDKWLETAVARINNLPITKHALEARNLMSHRGNAVVLVDEFHDEVGNVYVARCTASGHVKAYFEPGSDLRFNVWSNATDAEARAARAESVMRHFTERVDVLLARTARSFLALSDDMDPLPLGTILRELAEYLDVLSDVVMEAHSRWHGKRESSFELEFVVPDGDAVD